MRYFIRRIFFYVIALWTAVTLNFIIPRLAPGDPVQTLVGRSQGRIDPRAIAALELQFGINTKIPEWQQYFSYLGDLLHGKLGLSFEYYPTPVSTVIVSHVFWTMGLIGVASIMSFILGTLLGVVSAWRQGSIFDRIVPPALTFLSSIPYFYLALFFLYFLGFKFGWFPIIGAYSFTADTSQFSLSLLFDVLNHAILPALTIVLVSLAGWMVGMRNAMLNTLSEDYVLMAEAKGLSNWRVMTMYAARNAILPNITGFALSLGFVVGGSIIMESVFSYPGIGFLLFQAVQNSDYPLIQGIFLVIALSVLAANFLADIMYLILDPRVRY